MTTPLQITSGSSSDGAQQLSAVGEIDLSNVAEFSARLRDAVSAGERLQVDLTGVTYLDSAALAALFAHAEQIDIRIAPLNETLFTVSGLDQLTTVQVVPQANPSANPG